MIEFQEGFAGFIEGSRFVPYHSIISIDKSTSYNQYCIYYRDNNGNIDVAFDQTHSLVDLLTLLHSRTIEEDNSDDYDSSERCW